MTSARVARSVGTNPAVLRRLLGRLSEAGLVTSHRGALGGTELARSAESISLLAVYEAAGESELVSRHPLNRHCPFGRAIRPGLDAIANEIESDLRRRLEESSLADALETMRNSSAGDFLD